MVRIDRRLVIPDEEIRFRASRSSGPGGQHVQKASTRVTLLFDVAGSPSLSDNQRRRIMERLSTRISKEGILRVTSQRFRSQAENRRAALERFRDLVAEALEEHPLRRPTREPQWARKRRLKEKRLRGRRKRERAGKVGWEED